MGHDQGLALAHLFAFRVSAKLVAQGSFPIEDRIGADLFVVAVVVALLKNVLSGH